MEIIKASSYEQLSKQASMMIASQIIQNPKSVLGLATGSTPIGTYEKLIEYYEAGFIDFGDVTVFNLDEYWQIDPENRGSYYYYMQNTLFDHINIKKENTFIPSGNTDNPEEECKNYDKEIKKRCGIDFQLLGIGNNGHIGFNEPSNNFPLHTQLTDLTQDTIEVNSRFFKNDESMPKKAITLGLGGIMKAGKVLLIANGKQKLDAIEQMAYGKVRPETPASILQLHPNITVIYSEEN